MPHTSPRSPAVSVPQSPRPVAGDGRDAAVPAHYGDPFGEQRWLIERAGIVDRGHRDVVTVTGPDRLSWLHTLTTQQVDPIQPGTSNEALILTPQGRVAHHMVFADDGETVWLDTEPEAGGPLLTFLNSMRFMLRVELTDISARWGVLSVMGVDAPRLLIDAKIVDTVPGPVTAPGEAWPTVPLSDGVGWLRRTPWPTDDSFDVLAPLDSLGFVREVLLDAGARSCGLQAYEALRVADRRPRLGSDTDDRSLPHELGWVPSAVRLDKGCYPGQETVAKLHNMGQAPRRIVLLHLDGSHTDLPAPGEPVTDGDRVIGHIGTAVRHYELGDIALALVKRGTSDDASLSVAGGRASIDPEAAQLSQPDAGAGRRRVNEFNARRRELGTG
ncbi:MAG TPA: folate-binding protein [Mycobacteriales bacterium]|nr:folate-binding protein [Mycobacteriales bacterium]